MAHDALVTRSSPASRRFFVDAGPARACLVGPSVFHDCQTLPSTVDPCPEARLTNRPDGCQVRAGRNQIGLMALERVSVVNPELFEAG
jgi:hypothetical protein